MSEPPTISRAEAAAQIASVFAAVTAALERYRSRTLDDETTDAVLAALEAEHRRADKELERLASRSAVERFYDGATTEALDRVAKLPILFQRER